MAIDVQEIRERAAESRETVADAAMGAAVSVADAASNPVGTARKTVRRLEKRGAPVNRRLQQQVGRSAEQAVETGADVVSGNLAERLALAGIRAAKERARRHDLLGNVLFRGLELVHRGLDGYVEEVDKFRNATQPPTRSGRRTASPARPSAARTSASARRTSGRARRRTKPGR